MYIRNSESYIVVCRIRFGSNNLFVFIHPLQAQGALKKKQDLHDVTYEFALSEIARHSGLDIEDGKENQYYMGKHRPDAYRLLLQEKLFSWTRNNWQE